MRNKLNYRTAGSLLRGSPCADGQNKTNAVLTSNLGTVS